MEMETLTVDRVTFRLEGIAPESADYLRQKLERARRRGSFRRRLFHRLLMALLPRDYEQVSLESLARGRILVVGCAGGVETLGLGAVGIDIDRRTLRIANDLKLHAEGARASFLAASGGELPFRDESFDSLLSDNMIEHLTPSRVPRHLEEARRVLRPGGHYVFSTPNRLFEQPPKEGHVSLHSYGEWEELLGKAGFQEARTPRRRSGPLVGLEWKKGRERAALRGLSLGLSRQGLRTVTILAVR